MSLMSTLRLHLLKNADATLGALLCRILGNLDDCRQNGGDRNPPDPEAVRHILAIRPGGMGDMILCMPTFLTLARRYPNATIDVVCEARNAPILRLANAPLHPLPCDVKPLSFLRRLRTTPYDLAIDTEQFHNLSAVFCLLSGAPIRIGFKINPRRNPLYTHLVAYAVDAHESVQFARLLEPLGRPVGPMPELASCFQLPEPDAHNTPETRTLFIHPGSTTEYKQWPEEKWIQLASQMARIPGAFVTIIGGPAEQEQCRRVAAAASTLANPVQTRPGSLDIVDVANALRHSALFVGADSGLAHLAVAMGTPTVILFGPSDAAKWGIHDARHAIVRRPTPCAPCFIFGYHKPCNTKTCIRGIPVDAVFEACTRLTQQPR